MKMKKAEQLAFKERLLALRARLRGDMNYLSQAALSGAESGEGSGKMPIHMAEVGSENYAKEFALNLMANDGQTMESIESALERIEDGVYGACTECGKSIKKSRLNAIPYTAMCIDCAQALER